MEDKDDLPENVKAQMISYFYLYQFTCTEILTVVRKTNFFTDQEIFDVLEVKVNETEEISNALRKQLDLKEHQLSIKEEQMVAQTRTVNCQQNQLQSQTARL